MRISQVSGHLKTPVSTIEAAIKTLNAQKHTLFPESTYSTLTEPQIEAIRAHLNPESVKEASQSADASTANAAGPGVFAEIAGTIESAAVIAAHQAVSRGGHTMKRVAVELIAGSSLEEVDRLLGHMNLEVNQSSEVPNQLFDLINGLGKPSPPALNPSVLGVKALPPSREKQTSSNSSETETAKVGSGS